jgi:hypothetical protein
VVLVNRLAVLWTLFMAVHLIIIPAHTAPLNLTLGGPGAVSWNELNLAPGDNGTSTVDLHNAGTIDGYVAIWVANITESDYGGDGAALGTHIYFNPVNGRIGGNTPLPATIHQLPQDSFAPPYLYLRPLHAGETVSLEWQWEFVDTGVPQNDAQGDSLSFDLYYMLTELPPPEIEEPTENPMPVPTRSESAGRHHTHTVTLPGGVEVASTPKVSPTSEGINTTSPTPAPTSPQEIPLPADILPMPWLIALLGLLLLAFTLWRATVEEKMSGWLKATGIAGVLLSMAGAILIPYCAPLPACESLRIPCSSLSAAAMVFVVMIPLSGYTLRQGGAGPSPDQRPLHRGAGRGAVVVMAAVVIFGIMMYGIP